MINIVSNVVDIVVECWTVVSLDAIVWGEKLGVVMMVEKTADIFQRLLFAFFVISFCYFPNNTRTYSIEALIPGLII